MLNSLSFCLSVKLLSSSYLNEILAGYSNLGCRLFSFITLSMSCHSLLAWRVSIDRSAVILMGIPLCVICCFSLAGTGFKMDGTVSFKHFRKSENRGWVWALCREADLCSNHWTIVCWLPAPHSPVLHWDLLKVFEQEAIPLGWLWWLGSGTGKPQPQPRSVHFNLRHWLLRANRHTQPTMLPQ